MRFRLLVAIAVALAVVPATAAESESEGPCEADEGRVELRVPPTPRPGIVSALDGLGRLRLHPARDGFDVSEAVRRHPQPNDD